MMLMGYYINQGDKTTCGGQVLDGDPTISWDGLSHALEGHRVSCGKDGKVYKIRGGDPTFTNMGRCVAGTLDSFSGCPCRAQIIPTILTATYSREVSSPLQAGRAAAQPVGQPDIRPESNPQAADLSPESKDATSEPSSSTAKGTVICDHPDQLEEPARYIADEMNRNLHHPTVAKIKNLLSYDPAEARQQWLEQPWYTKLRGMPNFHGVAMGNQAAAAALWAKMVGQDRPWDHKPKLKALFNNVVWHKYGKYAYFFDIWSNVHYGYIGIACGFSEDWLFDGAGLEQIASDTLRKINDWQEKPGPRRSEGVEGLRAWDDLPDRISIFLGIKLYRKYPRGGLTPVTIMNEILSIPIADWGEGVRLHSCYDKQKQVST
jgi:uncharacterized Zn-binding protein involved in type VI secretion